MVYVGYLVVEDCSGSRLRVRKFRGRRFFKPVVRYLLESGEQLRPIGGDTFEVTSTGEKLLQLR